MNSIPSRLSAFFAYVSTFHSSGNDMKSRRFTLIFFELNEVTKFGHAKLAHGGIVRTLFSTRNKTNVFRAELVLLESSI